MEPENTERQTQPIKRIQLTSASDGKVTGISVYSGRAEITRHFKLSVRAGLNQVIIDALPATLDKDSLRIDGRGVVTIHDVTISRIPRPPTPANPPNLDALLVKKAKVIKGIERCQKIIASLESYLAGVDVQHIDEMNVGKVVKVSDTTGTELDNRLVDLEQELARVEEEINEERIQLLKKTYNEALNIRAAIGVLADVEGEIEISLIYAVSGTSWHVEYDIRVDTRTKQEQVMLLYKAAISQSTGEDWSDVPLTLETSTPNFGGSVPTLEVWSIDQNAQSPAPSLHKGAGDVSSQHNGVSIPNDSTEPLQPQAGRHTPEASSQTYVNATFKVPGLVTIPSDGIAHSVTIVELTLKATMAWVCVPKKDTKTHLSAKIQNASQYTFLPGAGNIYIDGNFVSRSGVPVVNPNESFVCPLGLDPSIQVTYHPYTKKQSKSGFYHKNTTHVFTQNITVSNTKSVQVDGIKILDQIPVSEDPQIKVNLINPPLPRPTLSDGSNSAAILEHAKAPVPISTGISAVWENAEVAGVVGDRLGKDGKLSWSCSIPPRSTVDLILQWEIIAPIRTDVMGLMLAICYS